MAIEIFAQHDIDEIAVVKWNLNSASDYGAQTFTPTGTFEISLLKVRLKRFGTIGGTGVCTVSIQGVDGAHKPNGIELASGSFDGNDVDNVSGELFDVTISSTAILQEDTEYCFVISCPDGTAPNYIEMSKMNGVENYSGGQTWFSVDSASTWGFGSENDDIIFQTLGTEAAAGGGANALTLSPSGEAWGF